jgi:hypothetical protein
MSVEELQEFRKKYAAIATASPVLIDEVLAGEDDADPELPFEAVDSGKSPSDSGPVSSGTKRRVGFGFGGPA